jgi:hypothetical protein
MGLEARGLGMVALLGLEKHREKPPMLTDASLGTDYY